MIDEGSLLTTTTEFSVKTIVFEVVVSMRVPDPLEIILTVGIIFPRH